MPDPDLRDLLADLVYDQTPSQCAKALPLEEQESLVEYARSISREMRKVDHAHNAEVAAYVKAKAKSARHARARKAAEAYKDRYLSLIHI